MKKVILIDPPFSGGTFPSVQLGTLKALLHKSGFDTEAVYANVLYKGTISFSLYEDLCTRFKYLDYSEFIFAPYAFPEAEKKHEAFREILKSSGDPRFSSFMEAQEKACSYLEKLACDIVQKNPSFIFIESSFKQLCASLAIAAKLKEKKSDLITIVGGTNCLGSMGKALAKTVSYVDFFLAGTNEFTLLELLQNINERPRLPAVIDCLPVKNMDNLPYPDYSEYFQTLDHLWMSNLTRAVSIETSRGCRWGEKSHCIFCGHQKNHLSYCKKSPERAVKEIEYLISRYDPKAIISRDAIIPEEYYDQVLKKIAIPKKVKKIFYEVKPDISLENIELLADKHCNIQAGLESFNNRLLKCLKKGQTAAKNILFLKNCLRSGVHVYWNFLYAIPGETENDYIDMIENIVPYITHLAPPGDVRSLVIQRFSPLFEEPETFGIKNIQPYPVYTYMFPENAPVQDLALYFTGDYPRAFDNSSLKELFFKRINTWRTLWQKENKPRLILSQKDKHHWIVTDTRNPDRPVTREIDSTHYEILEKTDTIPREKEESSSFVQLIEWGLLVKTGKKYLSVINLPKP